VIVRVDLGSVPPVVEVLDPDDLGSLKAVIAVPQHTWIDQDLLRAGASEAGPGPAEEKFSAMVDYAARHGWVDDRGRLRAHLEITTFQTERTGQERT
jgi:hypothetical protein